MVEKKVPSLLGLESKCPFNSFSFCHPLCSQPFLKGGSQQPLSKRFWEMSILLSEQGMSHWVCKTFERTG